MGTRLSMQEDSDFFLWVLKKKILQDVYPVIKALLAERVTVQPEMTVHFQSH